MSNRSRLKNLWFIEMKHSLGLGFQLLKFQWIGSQLIEMIERIGKKEIFEVNQAKDIYFLNYY